MIVSLKWGVDVIFSKTNIKKQVPTVWIQKMHTDTQIIVLSIAVLVIQ